MRTISKKTLYGLQALTTLARKYGEGPVLIATLAKDDDIPIKFLDLILPDLKNGGILESKKGPGGGYLLSRPPEKITLGSVIRLMEGPLAPLPCASETAYRPCEECKDVEHCGTRMVMREVREPQPVWRETRRRSRTALRQELQRGGIRNPHQCLHASRE